MKKTNAMRKLDQKKIDYTTFSYDVEDGKIDGVSVAEKTGQDVNQVFKTLVTRGKNNYYVFVIPVSSNLNLKKAAQASNEKKIEMIHQKELKPLTGYIHGGCSPIGMKKLFPTFLDSRAKSFTNILVSGGELGKQISINPDDLLSLIGGEYFNLTLDNQSI